MRRARILLPYLANCVHRRLLQFKTLQSTRKFISESQSDLPPVSFYAMMRACARSVLLCNWLFLAYVLMVCCKLMSASSQHLRGHTVERGGSECWNTSRAVGSSLSLCPLLLGKSSSRVGTGVLLLFHKVPDTDLNINSRCVLAALQSTSGASIFTITSGHLLLDCYQNEEESST
ncbi:hypothetical protein MJT46_016040 [Ovis ammon polii x Ovis aries]|nr:hypothetical protein MJT46_016040 [Ovis ammon polii x Ovis aries]